ncbi:acyl-CoA synthetase (AMP-forming)/AMP-acid ligase II [Variovorax sp. CF313]|nr:acyl-CoA synthetase (AMP-forming)/AMP-acid ligase II [Variovorax sp. CF313]
MITSSAAERADTTVSSLVFRALRGHPDRVAFSWSGGRLTYADTLALIGKLQFALAPKEGGHPFRVALLSANRAEAWCAEAAVQALRGSVTWLHPLGSLTDHLEQITDAQVDALILDAGVFKEHGADLAKRLPQSVTVWTLGAADFGKNLLAAAEEVGAALARDLSALDDIAILNYTGGTTGKSKGAVRRQRAQGAMALAVEANFELPAVPRFLAVAPISHVGGTLVTPVLLRGGTVELMPRFHPAQLLAIVERERINMTMLVPTMIYMLLDDPALSTTDLSSLELMIYGASPMSPTRLLEGLERIGPIFSQFYGQTECYPISLLQKSDHRVNRSDLFSSCGRAVALTEVRLLDDEGNRVDTGEAGEICVRAPYAMESYWQREDLTRDTIADGWVRTGDVARQDAEGYLFIVDRKKDMIVSGGFNVFPREVEDVLTSDPAVSMAAVIGVPDAKWGETVLAIVVARPGFQVDSERLIDLVKERKGAPHAPKSVEVVTTLPLTALGKIDKKALRQPYWGEVARQVA